ncbi:MAG: PAS domain S-box protein [Arcobacteraceae bacterium]|nr:PAS domain S-box protein [Arcobacteraceae bacterium]
MKKLLLTILSLVSIFIFINYNYYQKKIEEKNIEIYKTHTTKIKNIFRELVSQKQGKTSAITYILSQDKNVIEALLKNDKSTIDYTDTIKGIEQYDKYKNLWIQIIDKDGYSFYRSWTKKVGDSVSSIRDDVASMIKEPRAMNQVSTGRFDMTFKTILPLYHNKKFVGMIEAISHFNSIAQELKLMGIESIMLVDKSYKERFINPLTGLFIDDYYVVNENASQQLMNDIKDKGIEKFIYNKEYFIFNKYFIVTDQIRNINNKPMGYFIFFSKVEDIDMSKVHQFKTTYFQLLSIFGIVTTLLLLLYINRKFVKALNQEVQQKTRKISKQKEYLKSLLQIYDKNVIFSKTDPKGFITHVSEAFCKISGYTKEELIGQNHNIIRHPDMPKETFRYLWEELKKGNKVNIEVKNLKKDGGYYWVEAEIEPEYDKKGVLVGYNAVRENITANKDIEAIQKEIIFTMGSIGESRSKETGNHVRRVAEYSYLFARLSELDENDCEILKQASPMHDIGKVAIPDSILNKAGSLDDDEMFIMKTHVEKGYEMLKTSDRPLLKTAAIVALEHHERWDGKGYPNALKAQEISIYGRITAMADVFDALGSDRCYKKAWSDDEIFQYFKDEKGKHFDPKLVELFFDNLELFLEIRERYKDKF